MLCVSLLHDVANVCIANCAEQFASFLPVVTAAVVPVCQLNPTIQNKVCLISLCCCYFEVHLGLVAHELLNKRVGTP